MWTASVLLRAPGFLSPLTLIESKKQNTSAVGRAGNNQKATKISGQNYTSLTLPETIFGSVRASSRNQSGLHTTTMAPALRGITQAAVLILRQFQRFKGSKASAGRLDLTKIFYTQANHHTHESGTMATAYAGGVRGGGDFLFLTNLYSYKNMYSLHWRISPTDLKYTRQ